MPFIRVRCLAFTVRHRVPLTDQTSSWGCKFVYHNWFSFHRQYILINLDMWRANVPFSYRLLWDMMRVFGKKLPMIGGWRLEWHAWRLVTYRHHCCLLWGCAMCHVPRVGNIWLTDQCGRLCVSVQWASSGMLLCAAGCIHCTGLYRLQFIYLINCWYNSIFLYYIVFNSTNCRSSR